MKIIASNSQQIVKISKLDWQNIGKKAGWMKSSQDLLNVKKLEELDARELSRALRDAIIAEENAIKQYEVIADSTSNKRIKSVLQSLSDEERVHVGELQALLKEILSDEKSLLEKGEKEVKDI